MDKLKMQQINDYLLWEADLAIEYGPYRSNVAISLPTVPEQRLVIGDLVVSNGKFAAEGVTGLVVGIINPAETRTPIQVCWPRTSRIASMKFEDFDLDATLKLNKAKRQQLRDFFATEQEG